VQISHVAGDLASGLEFPPTLVAPASILRRRKAVSEPNGFGVSVQKCLKLVAT